MEKTIQTVVVILLRYTMIFCSCLIVQVAFIGIDARKIYKRSL